MFYWNRKSEDGNSLEKELLSCESVSKIKIATAFVSHEGVEILGKMKDKYSLKRDRITVYLSEQFSSQNPGVVLKELNKLCNVKIIFEYNFHAKVYFLQGKKYKLIFGSSNFTNGGMVKNIEFDSIVSPSSNEIESVNKFFDYCEKISTQANDEIIKCYENIQSDNRQLNEVKNNISIKLKKYIHKDDPFSINTYNINEYYFTYKDYETFFPRNRENSDYLMISNREIVQSKMIGIHDKIYPSIKKLGIECHKDKQHITSLISLNEFNQFSVGWLGVRYGKTPPEVDILNLGKEKDDDTYGFQKHGCLQYCIGAEGFEINLYLAVRHDAIDRAYLHEHLYELKHKIEIEISKLKGMGMEWIICNDSDYYSFDFDKDDPNKFCDFFEEYDEEGRKSFLRKFYKPDDGILKSKQTICNEIIRIIKILLPLYNTIVWRTSRHKKV